MAITLQANIQLVTDGIESIMDFSLLDLEIKKKLFVFMYGENEDLDEVCEF